MSFPGLYYLSALLAPTRTTRAPSDPAQRVLVAMVTVVVVTVLVYSQGTVQDGSVRWFDGVEGGFGGVGAVPRHAPGARDAGVTERVGLGAPHCWLGRYQRCWRLSRRRGYWWLCGCHGYWRLRCRSYASYMIVPTFGPEISRHVTLVVLVGPSVCRIQVAMVTVNMVTVAMVFVVLVTVTKFRDLLQINIATWLWRWITSPEIVDE